MWNTTDDFKLRMLISSDKHWWCPVSYSIKYPARWHLFRCRNKQVHSSHCCAGWLSSPVSSQVTVCTKGFFCTGFTQWTALWRWETLPRLIPGRRCWGRAKFRVSVLRTEVRSHLSRASTEMLRWAWLHQYWVQHSLSPILVHQGPGIRKLTLPR